MGPEDGNQDRREDPCSDSRYENVEKWKTLMEAWDNEADRFWARNNIFLIMIGSILTVIVAFSDNYLINVCISLFGIVFVMIWIRVNRIGKFYLDRWKVILKEFEQDAPIKVFARLEEMAERDPVASKYQASSTYMVYVLWLLCGIWTVVLLVNAYQLLMLLSGDP